MSLEQLSDFIILIAGVCGAITTIYVFFSKPTKGLKKKFSDYIYNTFQTLLDENMPKYLLEHDLETREKYKADRQKYLEEISNTIEAHYKKLLEEVMKTQENQSQKIDEIYDGLRSVLRVQIATIYHENLENKTLTSFERELLEMCYKQYTNFKGNSETTRKYKIMSEWPTVDDPADDHLL